MSNNNRSEADANVDRPSSSQRKLDEVQSILDRWEERLKGHHGEDRRDARQRFRGEILVHVPTRQVRTAHQVVKGSHCLRAWARNVSCNGISFLYSDKIDTVEVMICLNPQAKERQWYRGDIVRARKVQNDFWEYGVHLTGRVEGDPE